MTTEQAKRFNEDLRTFFKSQNVKIILRPEDTERDFNGDIEYFYNFIKEQMDTWGKYKSGNVASIYNHFASIINYLNQAIDNQQNNLHHAQGLVTNAINKAQENSWMNLYSTTDIANFIQEQYENHPDQAEAVIQYFFQNSTSTISNKFYFKGILNTFIWEEQNELFKPKVSSQKRALTELKNAFIKDRDELYGDFEEKHQEIIEMYSQFHIEIESWKQNLEITTDEYVTTNKEILEQFKNDKEKQLDELEKLYKEKLMLSAPASYWNGLSIEYNRKGKIWLRCSVGLSIVFAGILLYILFYKPAALFTDGKQFTFNTIRA